MFGDDEEDIKLLQVMASDAQTYSQSFSWCKSIREAYFGDGYGGIVAIFFFGSSLPVLGWTSGYGL
jgi:hypothetical protein